MTRAIVSSGAALSAGGSILAGAPAGAAEGGTVVDVGHDTTAADGFTTLREAIANAQPGDTITFDPAFVGTGNTINLDAQIIIDKDLTIDGPAGAVEPLLDVDAAEDGSFNGIDRVFSITSNAVVSIDSIRITGGGGVAGGGGILVDAADVTLTDVVLVGNEADTGGGALLDGGSLTLVDSTVSGNTALTGNGGGIDVVEGALDVQGSYFRNNAAYYVEGGGYGGAIHGAPGTSITIAAQSVLYDNDAEVAGGGVAVGTGSLVNGNDVSAAAAPSNGLHVLDSTIDDNRASAGGGIFAGGLDDLLVRDSLLADNRATGGFRGFFGTLGGGMLVFASDGLVDDSTIDSNEAVGDGGGGTGGGIGSFGSYDLRIRDTTISGNLADDGGGIASVADKYLLVDRSTVSFNDAYGSGGGIAVLSGPTEGGSPFVLRNSTVTTNTAGVGGGVSVTPFGGYLYGYSDILLQHSTITNNDAYDGGGLFLEPLEGNTTKYPGVLLDHTIVGVNVLREEPVPELLGPKAAADGAYAEIGGDGFVVSNFSLVADLAEVSQPVLDKDTQITPFLTGNPLLGALADNGGPTDTHLPATTSPAVDAGDTSTSAASTDQRGGGFARVSGPKIDIGAVELQRAPSGGEDPFECTPGFTAPATDVPDDNVHRLNIACLYEIGGTVGTGPTTYGPSEPTTRAQMASYIANVLRSVGVALPENPPDAYGDDEGLTHELSINQLTALGIVQGVSPGFFDPEGHITREQMAKFLVGAYRVATGTNPTASDDYFTDDETSIFEDFINVGFELDLFVGTVPGEFDPAGVVRRDQMATFLINLVDQLADDGRPPLLR